MATPIWQTTDDPFLVFHHTTPEQAREIVATKVFIVGHRGLFGPGIYAGADDPEANSLEWIRRTYSFGIYPIEALGGVVVFIGDDEQLPFEHVGNSTWQLEAPPGPLGVADIVVGSGELAPAGWQWSPGLLV